MSKVTAKLIPEDNGSWHYKLLTDSACNTMDAHKARGCDCSFSKAGMHCVPDTPEQRARIHLMGGTIYE